MGGKKGAPCLNVNAIKHGSYLKLARRRIDGRTALAKQLNALKRELTTDLGGDPSTAQKILIERVSFKVASLHFLEMAMSEGKVDGIHERYISLSNSLRHDLLALGLHRRQKDYLSYLDEMKAHSKEDKKNG